MQEQQQVHEQESSMSDTTSDDETSEDKIIMDGTLVGIVVHGGQINKLILL